MTSTEVEDDIAQYGPTGAQSGVWFGQQLDPSSPAYNTAEYLDIRGPLDSTLLCEAIRRVVAEAETLHVRIDSDGSTLHRTDPGDTRPLLVDLSGEDDPAATAESWMRAELARPADLARGPLFTQAVLVLAPERHLWFQRAHHFVLDGHSFTLMARRVAAVHAALVAGHEPEPSPFGHLVDLLAADAAYREGEQRVRDLGYWTDRFAGRDEPRSLAGTTGRLTAGFQRREVELPAELGSRIVSRARELGVSTGELVIAAVAVYTARRTGQGDVTLGVPVADRRPSDARTPGMLTNITPLAVTFEASTTFAQAAAAVAAELAAGRPHRRCRYEDLRRALAADGRGRIFGPLVNVKPWVGSLGLGAGEAVMHHLSAGPVEDVTLNAVLGPAGVRLLQLDTNTDAYDGEATADQLQRLVRLIDAVTADPSLALAGIDLLDEAEHRLLAADADTAHPVSETTLTQLLAEQAARTPDALALVPADGSTPLSYAELHRQADELAARLVPLGAGPGRIVAVAQPRSAALVISLLAVLRTGAAYAPLDIDHPAARTGAVLSDIAPVAILTAGPAPEALAAADAPVVDVLAQQPGAVLVLERELAGPGPDDLAYVIHTSGSTGRPKGVAISHRAVVNRLLWTQDQFGLSAEDRVLQKTSCAFDVSVWEFFWPLITGAALVLLEHGAHRDPAQVAAAIDRESITTVHFVPSMLTAYLDEPAAARPRGLRRILCSGEALPAAVARRAEDVTGAPVFNLYGPTEAAIDVSWWPLSDGAPGASVPIGRAVWNTRLHVLDAWGALVPPGDAGELHIAGDQLAVGYLGRPDLTAERFVDDPVLGRRYRTGDLVRRLESGALEFLGRLDHQVKIRGYRVELGEIEAVLAEHPEVAAAVVGTRDDRAGGPRLIAWVVPAGRDAGNDGARTRRWQEHLAARLPEHMVPAAIVVLDALPVTANGKLNRDALPSPEAGSAGREPDGPAELALTAILAEALGVERIGPDDDFFAAGGHSLTAARAATLVRARLGAELGVADVFAAPTAAGLAQRLLTAPAARPPLRPAVRPQRPPLSAAQRGLWFLDRLDEAPTYNIPLVLALPEPVDAQVLEAALGDVTDRHESLRTTFPAVDGVPYQDVRSPAEGRPALHLVDCPVDEIEACVAADVRRRLDITSEPGLWAGLYGPADGPRTLLLLLHHLVGDGWSLQPLARDLTIAYAARSDGRPAELPPLQIQYVDYALWQQDRLDPAANASTARDEDFWTNTLRNLPEEPSLPVDRPRPARPTARGGAIDVEVDRATAAALHGLALKHEASLFTVLHAGLVALLAGVGAGSDLAIGTPVAGRSDEALDELIGLITNTVVLRTDTSDVSSFTELLARVQTSDRAAWAHEDLPFERVVELVNPPRVPGRHPLFTVMLALQNNAAAQVSLGGRPVPLRPRATGTAKFDLFFDLVEHEATAGLTCHLEYARDLFEPGTAQRLADGLVAVLERAAVDPNVGLDSLVSADPLPDRGAVTNGEDATAEFDATLRSLSAVADCAVTELPDGGRVAWIVPSRPGAVDEARRALAAGSAAPPRVVPVTTLPRDAAGALDVAALHALPISDEVAAQRWRDALLAVPGVRGVTVTTEDVPDVLGELNPATRPRSATESSPAAVAEPAAGNRALSLSEGPALPTPAVAGWPEALRRAASGAEHAEIVHVRADGSESRRSYASLIEEANRVLGGLRALGLQAGDQVILQCADTEDFVAALWGAIAAGVTVVPLTVPPTYATDSAASNKLDGVWRMLGRPIVLTSAPNAAGLQDFASRRSWQSARIVTVDALRAAEPDTDWHSSQPDDLLLMLLTSGSTGLPKAVRLTHGNVLSRAVAAVVTNDLDERDVSLNWIPLDHVTGVVMFHLRDVYLGARQVHAPTGWVLEDPLRWWELADRWRVSVTWAPNFAFGLVVEQAERIAGRQWDLSPMRLIMNAGEVVVGATNRRFLQVLAPHGLPSTVLHPGWGMSETCSVVTDTMLASQTPPGGDETFVSCGFPYPGFSMRVVDDELQLRPEGDVGRLQVRGTSVTSGYHDNPTANADSFTPDGWFDTGDLAFLRDGELYITGRAKDVIIVNGVNHFSHEIEACVEELPVVVRSDTAAVAVRTGSAGTDQLALFVHLAPGSDTGTAAATALRTIRGKVTREVGVAPAYVVPVGEGAIPKTEIGKIQRTQLRKRFEAGEFDAALQAAEVLLGTATTVPNWFLRPVLSPVQRPRTADARASVLVLSAGPRGERLAEELAGRLRAAGGRCTTATTGTRYQRHDAARYTLGLDDVNGLATLLDRLAADGRRPERIVHLGPLDGTPADGMGPADAVLAAQRNGAESVLALVRALARSNARDAAVELRVVADGGLASATLPGLLASLRDERPGLNCGIVLVPAADADTGAAVLADELAVAAVDAVVDRRGDGRSVRRLAAVQIPETVTTAAPADGIVLITGGLGGVAAHLAEHLLSTGSPRLLLVGRTPLPDSDGDPSGAGRKLASLQQLGEVRYAAADTTDAAALDAVVSAATSEWAVPLVGILHLAGTLERRAVVDTDPAAWRAAIAAKVAGAMVLDRLADRYEVRSFVSFSSVNGTFGAAFSGPYAAACSFLDELAVRQRARGLDAQSLAWSTWLDTGMSEGDELAALGETRGYRALDVAAALRSYDLARGLDEPVLLIGADRRADSVRRLVDGAVRPLHRLAARVALDEGADLGVLHDAGMAAASAATGSSAPGAVLRAAGAAEESAASAASGSAGSVGSTSGARLRELENSVLAVWRRVLDRPQIGTQDNFFDLGGHSLLLVRAQAELNNALGTELTVVDVFAHPSARSLAEHLAGRSDLAMPDATAVDAAEQGTGQRDGDPPATAPVSASGPGSASGLGSAGGLSGAREQARNRAEARSRRNQQRRSTHGA